MSEGTIRMESLNTREIIAIQDIILEYMLSNHWEDYRKFARYLTEKLLISKIENEEDIKNVLKKVSHPFFSFNKVSKNIFIKNFPSEQILYRMRHLPKTPPTEIKVVVSPSNKKDLRPLTLADIFPEISDIKIGTAESLTTTLNIPERIIQNALREALKEKGATNITQRKSDSSLEIADIEDFSLEIQGIYYSFTSVVKGYRSVKGANISFKDIAHQVWKANDTNPNYILLVLAKPPKDGVITRLVKYGKDCGNRNLVVLVDPVDLARFLKIRRII